MINEGVTDTDYRGEIGIILHNMATTTFYIEEGQQIAQDIFERYCTPQIIQAEAFMPTKQNEGGFGSTGHKRVLLCQIDNNTIVLIVQTCGPSKVRACRICP